MIPLQLATQFLLKTIQGKYITNEHVKPEIDKLNSFEFKVSEIGKSVLNKPIYSVQFGVGKKKVLMWSQMHGNEPTTTKGLLDFLNFLNSEEEIVKSIKENFTILCIPILNPDGAAAYTRVNANAVDLNRDALDITQPESKLLRSVITQFKPDLCYNLHDQRTIFGTKNTGLPATMSFLAPAFNESCDYNSVRLAAITTISKINTALQQIIPNQVGRFDDAFNINCIGDYVTSIGIPTILFEAGHYTNDYNRDEVRKFVFVALLESFLIDEEVATDKCFEEYLKIPENAKCFYDFIYKNVKCIEGATEKTISFAAQYEEELIDNNINFNAKIVKINELDEFYGHNVYDAGNMFFHSEYGEFPRIDQKAVFCLNNVLKFSNGLQIL